MGSMELVDGFTYSISLHLGQAVYTKDTVPNLAPCQGPGLPHESG